MAPSLPFLAAAGAAAAVLAGALALATSTLLRKAPGPADALVQDELPPEDAPAGWEAPDEAAAGARDAAAFALEDADALTLAISEVALARVRYRAFGQELADGGRFEVEASPALLETGCAYVHGFLKAGFAGMVDGPILVTHGACARDGHAACVFDVRAAANLRPSTRR